jgi:Fic family protein
MIALKNEYETKIMQRDLDIRKRDEVINSIRKLLGVNESNQVAPSYSNNNLQLWLNKFTGGDGKILRILAENPTSFTRQQIALMTGLGKESVRVYVNKLKRALVVKEDGGRVRINPDL